MYRFLGTVSDDLLPAGKAIGDQWGRRRLPQSREERQIRHGIGVGGVFGLKIETAGSATA